jgi:hypothetical protein
LTTPPADEFLASYFEGHKWWSPPAFGGAAAAGAAEDETWDCPMPDVTD